MVRALTRAWRLRTTLLALVVMISFVISSCGRPRGGGRGGGSDDDDSANPVDELDPGTLADSDDPDGDGLTTSFEESIGTDPLDSDTDGDGYEDGEEYLNYFFPNDPTDYPYEGDYPRGPIPASVSGQGWNEGQISNNWTHADQHGQMLQLHRFYGNVVVVELAAEW